MKRVAVILVAGGSGERMGAALPKQFLSLCGETILEITLRRFLSALPDAELVVVLPEKEIPRWRDICRAADIEQTHKVCAGGATRFESVRNGIDRVGECDYIAIHDGVRPLVTPALIRRCLETATRCDTAVPVVVPTDSYRVVTTDGGSQIIDRSLLRTVQTPQVFRADILREAYRAEFRAEFTDDASVVEHAGVAVTLCEGERINLKITTPEDLVTARIVIEEELKGSREAAVSR